MSWVEELKPDDNFQVEIILPQSYVEKSMSSMRRYASGISHLCKGAAILGEDETEFLVYGMTTLQVTTITEAMKQFGVAMEHDLGTLSDGTRWAYFYADLSEMRKRLEEGENGQEEDE